LFAPRPPPVLHCRISCISAHPRPPTRASARALVSFHNVHTPSQVVYDHRATLASDMYSFGVLMWSLYAGQQPCVPAPPLDGLAPVIGTALSGCSPQTLLPTHAAAPVAAPGDAADAPVAATGNTHRGGAEGRVADGSPTPTRGWVPNPVFPRFMDPGRIPPGAYVALMQRREGGGRWRALAQGDCAVGRAAYALNASLPRFAGTSQNTRLTGSIRVLFLGPNHLAQLCTSVVTHPSPAGAWIACPRRVPARLKLQLC
jgi:hypothetical protein